MAISAVASIAKVRLFSGLVLMAFATTHLFNHAIGLVSVEAMRATSFGLAGFWYRAPFDGLLMTAFILHILATMAGLASRGTWRMERWQWLQVAFGLSIPFLLIGHYVGTRGVIEHFGVSVTYEYVLLALWPHEAVQQIVLVIVVWLHACLGMHHWLRLKNWYRRYFTLFLNAAVLLPVTSILGFIAGGREMVRRVEENPDLPSALAKRFNWPEPDQAIWAFDLSRTLNGIFVLLLLAVVVFSLIRFIVSRSRNTVRVAYDSGEKVRIRRGMTVLDASRRVGHPHASVCGGRGRCSTCRVRVMDGVEHLDPPGFDEARVLQRVGAGPDIRLGCQIRPVRDIRVVPLVPVDKAQGQVLRQMNPDHGVEREIAVLFCDLRDFTRFSESRLAYDVVFILNSYFRVMGSAIERSGGQVDKFIGDGIMALFGIGDEGQETAVQAMKAAKRMSEALIAMNEDLKDELRAPLRMGIGIHMGTAIIGQMGYGRTTSMTAIGDTVNVASRLEGVTKEHGVELVVSNEVVRKAGLEDTVGKAIEIDVRGRRETLTVYAVTNASALPLNTLEQRSSAALARLRRRMAGILPWAKRA